MYLTNHLRKYFNHTLQSHSYKYQRKAKLSTATRDSVAAIVRGTRRFQVNLARQDDQILAECDCSAFASSGVCEHLWAVIVVAEQRGALRGDDMNEPLELVKWEFDKKGEHLNPAIATQLAAKPRPDKWKKHLGELGAQNGQTVRRDEWPATRQILYVIDVATTLQGRGIYLELFHRDVKKNGEWGRVKYSGLQRSVLSQLSDPDDRFALSLLLGASTDYGYSSYNYSDSYGQARYRLLETQPEILLPLIARTGRCYLRMQAPAHINQNDINEWLPVAWDDGPVWQFRVVVEPQTEGNGYDARGYLLRDGERMRLSEPVLFTDAGIFFTRERAMRYDHGEAFDWVTLLRKHKELKVTRELRDEFLGAVLRKPTLPPLDLPEEMRYETVQIAPRPHLMIKPPDQNIWQNRDKLRGELSFAYGEEIIAADEPVRGIYQAETRVFFTRDEEAEQTAAAHLFRLGWSRLIPDYYHKEERWLLVQNKLPRVVRELIAAGWHVEAEGKVYRHAGAINIQVSSGIDWFDLHGTVDFDGVTTSLPALLAALKRGETFVALGDGTFGLLPEEWLQKYGLLAGLGESDGEKLRFKRSQVGVLDALLASQPEATFDETFSRAREELKRFNGVHPAEQPEGFVGELRGYQKEGLGWMDFLQRFSFGGCLADDMGVGKTPQVLALLETRRQLREETKGQRDKGTEGRRDGGEKGQGGAKKGKGEEQWQR